MFNTIRFYYDKDFLIKNSVFKKGIGSIPLSDFNWLNFFLTDEEKLTMFIRGAQAACGFLQAFKWADYRAERIKMQQILNERQEPEKMESGYDIKAVRSTGS
jgi:NTE family protein